MKRKIYEDLLRWKQEEAGRTALLIDGARRVGKSYIAETFAKAEYKSYLVVDFNRVSQAVTDLFLNYMDDLDLFFLYLSNYYNVKLYPRETLIILDEVQLFPKARAAIKYLVADGRYDYIETGSLMSIRKNVQDIVIPSEERHIKLHPMDFEEFLWGMGISEDMIGNLCGYLESKTVIPEAIHSQMMNYYRQYIAIGGMPEAVQKYATVWARAPGSMTAFSPEIPKTPPCSAGRACCAPSSPGSPTTWSFPW